MASKRTRKKPAPELVPFVARFVENERAGLRCSCVFPDKCDGSRLIACEGNARDGLIVLCDCKACPEHTAEHVTGCQGCEQCNRAECGTCGTRSATEPADAESVWYCSPECSRKAFTVAS